MRITDLLNKSSILLSGAPGNKEEAVSALIDLQLRGGKIADREEYRKAIMARESLGTTAVGDGIAIPHAKCRAVTAPSLAAMTVPDGVDYGAEDGGLSTLLFMIAAPEGGDGHLEVLSRLMTLLMDEGFRERLMNARSREEFLRCIDSAERSKYPDEASERAEPAAYRILAVTACPTGIAHTYMAAEALEKAGKELGIPIKVETNGSGGVKNALTKSEIEDCEGIIVAADKSVEMSRFEGKKVLITKVSDGIRKPEELIRRIEMDSVPVYHHGGAETADGGVQAEGVGRQAYKHLMNGVSNMLPFTVAGGIFIALAFLIDTVSGAPQNESFGSFTPAAAFFKTIGGFAFDFMIPVLAAFIGSSIADRPGFLAGLVGGSLAAAGSTFAAPAGSVSSGFLGALFAGFAGGVIMRLIMRLLKKVPRSLEGIKPVLLYPLAGLLTIAAVMCAVNPFMGMLNYGLTSFLSSMGSGSKIALGCVLGAMMSIDMGGPLNKAAYVFGTAAIASGNYDIMAAVMVGGMVPPIAIALCTSFFGELWTAEERKSGAVNYIMGLSFITEGAIPYAAADPLRVIPACMIGSAIAGGLSMAFGCTLMAPHGGIFVFAVVGSWFKYLLSLAAGAASGMLVLAMLKKHRRTEVRHGN